jgi:hypothetical protein
VLFGAAAARALLPPGQNRRRTPQIWLDSSIPGMQETLPCLFLPGLSEMLKTPPLRRDAWAGLRLLRRSLDATQT